MNGVRCHVHRYSGGHNPHISCATCWAIRLWTQDGIDQWRATWRAIHMKGMNDAVKSAMVELTREFAPTKG